MQKKSISFLISFFLGINLVFSQEIIYNQVYKENIETVLLYKEGFEIYYPIIFLDEDAKLILSFDEIDEKQESKDYQYTIIHCNSDWTPSDLMFSEYIDGFEENDIDDFSTSFSTFCKYLNYQVKFPNDYIKFTKSGNYIIKVYENYDVEDVVLTKRFYIAENLLKIDATVKKATKPSLMDYYQEVDFSIDYSGYKIKNPLSDLKIIIMQNNRTDNMISELVPKYINNNVLEYNYDLENTFPAVNEFRYFDVKNLKFSTEKIGNIEYKDNYYHIYLRDEKIRSTEPYLFNKDINGIRFINSNIGVDQSTDADYCFVHFIFKRDFPFTDGNLYIFSDFTDWKCDEKYKLEYNNELQQYETVLFLKQGYYNYYYALKSGEKTSTAVTEGNFYQTENDYIIYVYQNDSNLQYDRLIAVKICSSEK